MSRARTGRMRRLERLPFAAIVLLLAAHAVYAQRSPQQCLADTATFRLLPNYPVSPRSPAGPDTTVHSMCNVDRPARIDPSPPPDYPPLLASAKVGGEVIAQFIVLANGSMDTTRMHVLRSTNGLFTKEVRRAVVSWHAQPARYRGQVVSQLVEYEFRFKLKCQIVEPYVTPPTLDVRASGSVQICACSTTQLRPDPTVYTMCDVDQAAKIDPSPPPAYPAPLVSAHVDGAVLLTFVVLETGGIDMSSVHVLRSTHDLFTTEVRWAIASWHAKPARYRGQVVKQIVEYEFRFEGRCGETDPELRPPSSAEPVSGTLVICRPR